MDHDHLRGFAIMSELQKVLLGTTGLAPLSHH